jgi:hypothetical protein
VTMESGLAQFDSAQKDESLQIVIFVCIPLLLLLVFGLIVRWVRRPRFSVTFPDFSLTINSVGGDSDFVMYRKGTMQTAFSASLGRGRRRRSISVQIPSDLRIEQTRDIVRDLVLGLSELGYEYRIFRKREPRQVSPEERAVAIERLQKMGVDITRLSQSGVVTRLTAPNGLRVPLGDMESLLPEIHKLISQARGIEERIEILESSAEK